MTAVVLMEAGAIDLGTNELAYGVATIVIGLLPIAAVEVAVLLIVRHHRHSSRPPVTVESRGHAP